MSTVEASVGSSRLADALALGGSARHIGPPRRIKRGLVLSGLHLRTRRQAADWGALTDNELLAMTQAGDPEAFALIYDRHSAAAFSLARRICRDPGVAEDVVQDAFLALWRGRDRYDAARGQVRSWLLGIVHNSAIDRLRRSGVHERRRASAEGIEDRLEAPDRTEEEVALREDAARVRAALGGLPAEQRLVIELAYFDGLTHTQIAGKLDQPVGTIKGRMRLGLLKLHAELSDDLAEEVAG
jgi:RNA polymerase sigma-70 factor (ECF subfamily)